jgi:hypothetical protein
MKTSLVAVIATTLLTLSAQAKPKYAATTTRLVDSTDYVRKSPAPDFWALIPHYVPQGENMCQTATMVMVFNALRNHEALDSETKNITQQDLWNRVNDPKWKKAMKEKKCYGLDQFADVVRRALEIYFKDRKFEVRVEHVDSTDAAAATRVVTDLKQNEASDQDFIIANFDQAVFTGESEPAGHISAVGAYDAAQKRVLVLDVDREWYTPYWVPEAEFLKGLATGDAHIKGKNRGYLVVSPKK